MALDGIILHKIHQDLIEKLPMRINRIAEVSSNEIVFNIHSQKKRTNLVISCHSVYNRICFSNQSYNSFETPSGFIMLLRKHLSNGIIYEISQGDFDRYLILKIRALDDLYDQKEYRLYVELMGKYANIILVDHESGKILDALKRIPPYENSKRTILAGAKYTLPEPQNKKNPFIDQDIDLDESLVKQFAGFSKLLENEVRHRLNRQTFKEIMDEIKNSEGLYISELKDRDEYHVIPLTHLNVPSKFYSFEAGFDHIYYHLEEKERIRKISDDLYKYVRKQKKHFKNKIIKLQESYEDALNLEKDRNFGDLLYTYSNLNQKGLSQIEVEDYEGNLCTITLDPKLNIKENANKYYQIYQKKRKGQEYILAQLEIAKNEEEYFTSLDEQLEFANFDDAVLIKEELTKYGYLRQKKSKHPKKKAAKVRLYQIHFEDYTITFGKNNIQNDFLSFKYAKPNDLWFHAKDFHGSHLVINSSEPSEEALRLCATIAAYFSKGRYSSSVPVDYCLVKDIKKIKGSKAGFVSIKNQKTIYIDPQLDPSLQITLI